MKRALVALAVFCLGGIGLAQSDPAAALDRWAGGKWVGDGTFVDSPMGKAFKSHGVTQCAWSPAHVFLVCDQTVDIGGKQNHDLSLYTWDPESKEYKFTGLSQGGGRARTPKLTIEGDTWTYSSSFETNGKTTYLRTVNVWKDADTVDFRVEYSTDEKEWHAYGSGTNKRTK